MRGFGDFKVASIFQAIFIVAVSTPNPERLVEGFFCFLTTTQRALLNRVPHEPVCTPL